MSILDQITHQSKLGEALQMLRGTLKCGEYAKAKGTLKATESAILFNTPFLEKHMFACNRIVLTEFHFFRLVTGIFLSYIVVAGISGAFEFD